MPYLTLGTTAQLQIKVPTNGTTDWGDTLKTDTFQKIAEHNHTGSGTGSQLGTGSIQADAITGLKIRLANDQYLRARDNANSTDVNIVKVNTSDQVVFGADIVTLNLVNDTYLTGRNAADSANIDIVKVNAFDKLVMGADIATATVDLLTGKQTNAGLTVVLADATGPVDATVITLAANETCKIRAKVVRNGLVSVHTIELDQDNATINEIYSGDATGVTFSIASDQLQYTTTSTGFTATMTYTVIKE